MNRPVLNIINEVPMLCYPGGISVEVSRTDPRYAEAIRQIEAEDESSPSIRSYEGGNYSPIAPDRR